ncbi:hypothetical protein LCGC14_2226710 [marine sediment metagenome]|uniref:Uncharacterized protein n=1 Tax=marine sediment metagenome TaxID=412755 RepID=A0A0F9D9K2_9ZZZZ
MPDPTTDHKGPWLVQTNLGYELWSVCPVYKYYIYDDVDDTCFWRDPEGRLDGELLPDILNDFLVKLDTFNLEPGECIPVELIPTDRGMELRRLTMTQAMSDERLTRIRQEADLYNWCSPGATLDLLADNNRLREVEATRGELLDKVLRSGYLPKWSEWGGETPSIFRKIHDHLYPETPKEPKHE